ncbi:aminopeptidase C [Paenibacillus montanisoli]|uniref:Aminopeptidase n=1 Tax=Paenibacillus montanisoli TaxID=2081970 RepID=A0A328U4Y1_9BACL|nr:C1 family peptidase [Paenibacillus montanisoli]RAP77908.1 aminopeptidase [Paenibacillus montanisoli]
MSNEKAISQEMLQAFKTDYRNNVQYQVSQNAIIKNGIRNVAINHRSLIDMKYHFSIEIPTGKVTHQKQSGRCWMFAGLNILREIVAKRCNLHDFEISQNHLMFWDKFEKANFFLESILETIDEDTDSRLVSWLLMAPVQDGGQWDMYVSLIEKYGVVPKEVMPETFHSSQSGVMNALLTVKLREQAAALRKQRAEGADLSALASQKQLMLNDIYRILCLCLGEPPERFDFEYRDKDKAFTRDADLTPQQFYQQYIGVDLGEYVSVIHAPTKDKPYGKSYTVQYLGNVHSGRQVKYLNVDIGVLKQLAVNQLQDGEPIWFGCDVGQMSDRDTGIMDTALYHYEAALHTVLRLTKEERLDYRESVLTHAMVFTGVNLVNGKPNRWKVQNSWGCEPGKDGYFIMSDDWFEQFMYQVVIHKKYLSPELAQAFEQQPVELAPWDPMGSLAVLRMQQPNE